jgi:hypothetical protein
MRAFLVLGLAALSLAACNKPKPAAAGGPAAAANTAAPGPLALPQRKAGVWEIKMQVGDRPAFALRRCFSAGEITGEDFQRGPGRRMGAACKPTVSRQLDGSIKYSSDCETPMGGHAKSEGVIKGDFVTHYHADMTTTFSGTGTPLDGTRQSTMDATYFGACPPGVEPGAMLNASNQPMSQEELVEQFKARREARRAAREAADGGEQP